MHHIVAELAKHLSKLENTPVIVAFSGGVDSCVLLSALVELKRSSVIQNAIYVCHVNHGLSPNADTWQQHAEQLCSSYQLPFIAKQVNINVERRQSLEAVAREQRYKVLSAVAQQYNGVVLTGHHLDDQAETFLLALKRGAGIRGLAAMQSDIMMEDFSLRIVRPLLSISRDTIEEYANERQLSWVEDESNTNTQFDRNFLRQQVMPLLSARWPSIATTIARSASHCQSANELLNELAQDDFQAVANDDNSLNCQPLYQLSQNRINNLMRFWINQHSCVLPSQVQLHEAMKQLSSDEDKMPAVKVGELWLRRHKQSLYLTPEFSDVSYWQQVIKHSEIAPEITTEVKLPDDLGQLMIAKDQTLDEESSNASDKKRPALAFSLPDNYAELKIVFAHDNPICLPDYRQHSRKLKKILQELNIPVWQRQRIPFIYCDQQLVAVVGYFVCQPFLPQCHPIKLSIHWSSTERSG